MTVDIVVHTTLDGSAEEVERFRFGVGFIVVEVVNTPVAGIAERAGENKVELAVENSVFTLHVSAFLMSVAIVVTINDITNAELLVHPVRVLCSGIVFGLHVVAARVVDIVFTAVKVDNLVVVVTNIVTEVETGSESELLGKYFIAIGRNQAIPFVAIVRLAHNHVRTGSALTVHLFDFIVGKCAVGMTEKGVECTVR